MMTFSRRARTKQYARGNDKPSSFITSAMQMVADRETPTLQCTKVAVPSLRPFSDETSVRTRSSRLGLGMRLTNKLQTPPKLIRKRVNTIILDLIHKK